jgi:hypothetical protein|tara:strand:+ start:241 stop:609 length:369 start_codon:yes stop_codon:yes gene_type:complete
MIKYSTRLVFILRNVVIKIPVTRKGYLQGLNEKKIWNKYNNVTSLAELKWMWMGIVCQKRYNTVSSIPSEIVKGKKELIPEFDFDNCDLYNPENWGIDGKIYILLDYGVTKYIAGLYKQENL